MVLRAFSRSPSLAQTIAYTSASFFASLLFNALWLGASVREMSESLLFGLVVPLVSHHQHVPLSVA